MILTFTAIENALLVSPASLAETRFVDDDAQVGGDGLSWSTAHRYLRDPLSDVGAGVTEIRVAQGTYLTDRSENFPNGMGVRTARINLVTGVVIRGGYAGQGAIDPDERDVSLYETIISGDIGVPGDDSDNSYHVIVGDGEDATAVLDGFTITAGNADGGSPNNHHGGGMSNFFGSPTVIDCTFVGNVASSGGGGMCNRFSGPTVSGCTFRCNTAMDGGGMYNFDGSPVVINCTFTQNSATVGGGMNNASDSTTLVTNCTFTQNSASSGGGMHNKGGSATVVTDCTFDGNTCGAHGGAIGSSLGTGMTISGCSFANNIAGYNGGAVFISNDGAVHNRGPTTMIGCTLTANVAEQSGGGLFATHMTIRLNDVTMSGNSASAGGGMSVEGGSAVLRGVTLSGNSAIEGGGLHSADADPALNLTNCLLTGNQADFAGGAMYNVTGNPALTNCTFAANSSGADGGALMFNVGAAMPAVANCILRNDFVAGIVGDATIIYSNVQGGWPGEGNIDRNPLFADPMNGDFSLLPGSSCIDAANNNAVPATAGTDLGGDPRFADDLDTDDTGLGDCPLVDMGAYEFPTRCPSDLDCDGTVGINDFLDLLAQWGTNPGGPPDFDGDGDVGITDFLALLANWGPC